MVGLRRIDRSQNIEVSGILDHARSVPRSEVEIRDDRIPRIVRVDLAIDASHQFLVLPNLAERTSVKRGRLDACDFHTGYAGRLSRRLRLLRRSARGWRDLNSQHKQATQNRP